LKTSTNHTFYAWDLLNDHRRDESLPTKAVTICVEYRDV
jgi:hypothetical protein